MQDRVAPTGDDEWKQYAYITNRRIVFAFCCKEARRTISAASILTQSSKVVASMPEAERVKLYLAALPEEIVKMIGIQIAIPQVYVTQLTWNRGAQGRYGPVMSICGHDVYCNNVKMSGVRFSGTARHELMSWKVEDMDSDDPVRPSSVEIYFDAEFDSFSGMGWWPTEGPEQQHVPRLIFGRKVVVDGKDPFEGQCMWNQDPPTA